MGKPDDERPGYGMGGLLFDIYDQIVSEGQEAKRAGDRIGRYVERVGMDGSWTQGNEAAEGWKDLIYSVTKKAEQEGFCLGAQFVLTLLLELFLGIPED